LNRRTSIWIGLTALLLLALVLPDSASERAKSAAREALSPMQGLISGTWRRLRNAGASIRGWGGLPEENRKLAETNLILQNRVLELQSLEDENLRLRELLAFQRRSRQQLIAAEVIARDLSGWWRSVRLDKGARDGVALDQAVVTGEGLVGKIISVSERTSDVLLISDPNCRLSVVLARQASHGILAGKGVSRRGHAVCEMDLINKDLPVARGAEVLSSGLGGVFPRGWKVGSVETVAMDASGLFQKADVIPSADLNNLAMVFVIKLTSAEPAPVGRGS
jgi:rod shape-determining protein MreC